MNSENQFWEDLESGKVVSVVKESSKGRALSSSKKLMKIPVSRPKIRVV